MDHSPASAPNGLSALRPTLHTTVQYLPGPVRFRAANALEGLKRARLLFSIDREIASFRVLTSEEEAAAALFQSLKMRGYPRSDQLDMHLHQHKAAVRFFLAAVYYELIKGGNKNINLTLSANPPRLTVSLPLAQFGGPEDLQVTMDEPLGIFGTRPGVSQENYFDGAVRQVSGDRRVDKLISKAANARNRMLYAHDGGLPKSELTLHDIAEGERHVDSCILLAVAILQVEKPQAFALQCLEGFLKIVGRSQSDIIT